MVTQIAREISHKPWSSYFVSLLYYLVLQVSLSVNTNGLSFKHPKRVQTTVEQDKGHKFSDFLSKQMAYTSDKKS
jgi:hypothetical protein